MTGPMWYGGAMGFAFALLSSALPGRWLAVVIVALAVHLARGAWVCWRRTGLTLAAMAMSLGATNFAVLAGFERAGHRFPDWPAGWLVLVVASFAVGGLCMAAEPYVHPRAWSDWGRYMEQASGWDILLGRHIPDLRARDRDPVS